MKTLLFIFLSLNALTILAQTEVSQLGEDSTTYMQKQDSLITGEKLPINSKKDTLFESASRVSKQVYSKGQSIVTHFMAKSDTIYNCKDSSLFNGVIHSEVLIEDSLTYNHSTKTINCIEGVQVSMIEKNYVKYIVDTSALDQSDGIYLAQIVYDWGDQYYRFSETQDTVSEGHWTTFDGKLFHDVTNYYADGAVLSNELTYDEKSYEYNETRLYGPKGKLVEFSWYKEDIDTCTIANEFIRTHEDSLYWYLDKYCRAKLVQYVAQFDEQGDTLYSMLIIDERKEGVKGIINHVIQDPDGNPVSIVTLWRDDYMVDVLHQNIIYVGKGNKLITEGEFLYAMGSFPGDLRIYPFYIPSMYWFEMKAEIILYTPRAAARLKTEEQVGWSIEKVVKRRRKQLR
ncbi:MAG: hypothetical protein ACI8ZM_001403 [Crocinitomix sp.]|jgi:hypothetical protein